jgi:hypothetical protein
MKGGPAVGPPGRFFGTPTKNVGFTAWKMAVQG